MQTVKKACLESISLFLPRPMWDSRLHAPCLRIHRVGPFKIPSEVHKQTILRPGQKSTSQIQSILPNCPFWPFSIILSYRKWLDWVGFTVGSNAKKHERKVAKLYVLGIPLSSFFLFNKNSTCCMTFNQFAMHALHFIRLLPKHALQVCS